MSVDAVTTVDLATVRRHPARHVTSDRARPRRYRGRHRHANADDRLAAAVLAGIVPAAGLGAVLTHLAGMW